MSTGESRRCSCISATPEGADTTRLMRGSTTVSSPAP